MCIDAPMCALGSEVETEIQYFLSRLFFEPKEVTPPDVPSMFDVLKKTMRQLGPEERCLRRASKEHQRILKADAAIHLVRGVYT